MRAFDLDRVGGKFKLLESRARAGGFRDFLPVYLYAHDMARVNYAQFARERERCWVSNELKFIMLIMRRRAAVFVENERNPARRASV